MLKVEHTSCLEFLIFLACYFPIISFAGLLCSMGNPWFQEGSQSLLQLSSTGAYTVLWNLDIWSRIAKQ
jgi:hypothetical protein